MQGTTLNQLEKPQIESSSCGQEEIKCLSFKQAGDIFESREKLSLIYDFLTLKV